MKIFISYRRADTAHIAGRIYDRLVAAYGRDNVFKDVDSIPLGVDFRAAIQAAVSQCDAMVVVMGPNWLTIANSEGPRLEQAEDFVRLEIEFGMARRLRLIPLLVEGAHTPRVNQLPESLVKLADFNGTKIRVDPDFHHDMDRVIQSLGPSQQSGPSSRSQGNKNTNPEIESGFQLRVYNSHTPAEGRVFPLNKARLVAGRSGECDIVTDDLHSSRWAFALEWDWSKKEFSISSMSPRFTVLITRHDQEIMVGRTPHVLAPGDKVTMGESVFLFEKTSG